MKVSIIIVNHNGQTFLTPCLLSVQEAILSRTDVEVILADNGSTDQSISVTKKILPTAKILSLDRNYGFAEANNRAAKVAHGEYLVFLNNDIVADKEWLEELIKVADSDPSTAICGSRIMFLDLKDRVNYAGGKITMICSGYDQRFGMRERLDNAVHSTGYACGASMLVEKSVFHRLGGFDLTYFALSELPRAEARGVLWTIRNSQTRSLWPHRSYPSDAIPLQLERWSVLAQLTVKMSICRGVHGFMASKSFMFLPPLSITSSVQVGTKKKTSFTTGIEIAKSTSSRISKLSALYVDLS